MKCPKCGAELQEDSQFCNKCGTKIESIIPQNITKSCDKQLAVTELNPTTQIHKSHRTIKIIVVILGVLLVLVGIVFGYIIPESQYNKAKSLFSTGDFNGAIVIYSSLGDYKDSKNLKEQSQDALREKLKRDDEKGQKEKQAVQQSNLKNEMLQKISSCPLVISSQRISNNSIGEALSSVTAKNTSNKTIDAFTIYVYCYDNFNHRVNHYVDGTNIFQGIKQDKIKPNESINSTDYYWTMHGFDNTTKIQAIVKEIHYTDNTNWILDDKYLSTLQQFVDEEIVQTKFQ